MSILAIDAGTTGVTAVVVTPDGRIQAKGYQEFRQHFPQPGWVEHSAEEIWQATLEATREVLTKVDQSELTAVGITNQRETSCCGTARRSARPAAPSCGRTVVRPTSATGCARTATRTASPSSPACASTPTSPAPS